MKKISPENQPNVVIQPLAAVNTTDDQSVDRYLAVLVQVGVQSVAAVGDVVTQWRRLGIVGRQLKVKEE